MSKTNDVQTRFHRWSLAVCGMLLLLGVATAKGDGWLEGWKYRKQVTIVRTLAVNSDQTNFPVLVRTAADSDLAARAKPDGADLCVTAADGTTLLGSEVEEFDAATGELTMWVKIPLLSPLSNSVVQLYYGNPDVVAAPSSAPAWNGGYQVVWHMGDSAAGTTVVDSTSAGDSGTKKGYVGYQPLETAGKVGRAQDFSGGTTNTSIEISRDSQPLPTGSFSFWAMSYTDVNDDTAGWLLDLGRSGGDATRVFVGVPGSWDNRILLAWGKLFTNYGLHYLNNDAKIFPGNWFHLTVTWDGDKLMTYTDGKLYTSETLARVPSFGPTRISLGGASGYNKPWKGVIDEFRLSSVAHSADWIATDYRTQSDPERYLDFGPQREKPRANAFWLKGWLNRKMVTISHGAVAGGEDLADFPVPVAIDVDAFLATGAHPTGSDLVLTAADGITTLPHEIEEYDSASGKLLLWVRAPRLSATTDTILYLYYGNQAAADQQDTANLWDNRFVGVWHLKDATPTTVGDSTIYGFHGTKLGTLPSVEVAGKIGKAQDFLDDRDDRLRNIKMALSSFPLTSGSISMWLQNYLPLTNDLCGFALDMERSSTANHDLVVNVGIPGSHNDLWMLRYGWMGGTIKIFYMNNGYFVPRKWFHLALTWENTPNASVKVYQNGVYQATVAWDRPLLLAPLALNLGAYRDTKYAWYGMIDEVRLSDTVRSAGWITTDYNLQNDPGAYVTVGRQESPLTGTAIFIR